MSLEGVFNINQNIIQINYNQNVPLFSQNLVKISMEASQSVRKTEKHNLIFEVAISFAKRCFLLITFSYSDLMIGNRNIKLGKPLNIGQLFQELANKKQGVLIFNYPIIGASVINIQLNAALKTFMKKMEAHPSYLDSEKNPVFRCVLIQAFRVSNSTELKLWIDL